MAAPFLKRIQRRHVNPLFGAPLADVFIAVIFGSFVGGAAYGSLSVFEISFTGMTALCWAIGLYIFSKMLKWYRLRGDGVIRKDGIYRVQQSNKIHRVVGPGRTDAESEFVVVTATAKQKEPFLERLVQGLVLGLGLRPRPESSNRVPGDRYCEAVARRYRASLQTNGEQ